MASRPAAILRDSSSLWPAFFIIFHLCYLPTTSAIACVSCEGSADCVLPTCTGDFCFMGKITVTHGDIQFKDLTDRIIKGCVTDSLSPDKPKDYCAVLNDSDGRDKACFCRSQDFCNRNIHEENIRPVPVYTCEDSKGSTCKGEFCTITYNRTGGVIERGCGSNSLPLIERHAIGGCMQPPMTSSFHAGEKDIEKLLHTKVCLCKGANCNAPVHLYTKHPQHLAPEQQTPSVNAFKPENRPRPIKCLTSMGLDVGVGFLDKKGQVLECDYCFNVTITKQGNPKSLDFRSSHTAGCLILSDEANEDESLRSEGCVAFQSDNIHLSACFKTDAKRRQQIRVQIEKKKIAHEKALQRRKEMRKEKTRKERERQHQMLQDQARFSQHKQRIEPHSPLKQQYKQDNAIVKNSIQLQERVPNHTPKPSPDDKAMMELANDNSTVVTVFITLIIVILISGAVWKFQFHKRLARSSYEVVST